MSLTRKIRWKKCKRKYRNTFLKAIAWLMGAVCIMSAMLIDAESIVPAILCVVSLFFLICFFEANNYFSHLIDSK